LISGTDKTKAFSNKSEIFALVDWLHCKACCMVKRKLVAFILFLVPFSVIGQSIEVGLTGGGSYYIGDLNPSKHFLGTDFAFGAVARYNQNTRWAFKFNVLYAKVKGSDQTSGFQPDRGLSFESTVLEAGAHAEFNFLSYFTGSKRNSISPFIFAGLSLIYFNPTSGGTALRSLGTEGQNVGFDGRKAYSTISAAIPFGIGVKFSLSKRLCLTAEWGMRKTFTDYLDDVSKTYYLDGASINPDDPGQLLSDPTRTHQPYMQRGNSRTKDWFDYSGLTLTYKFNLRKATTCKDYQTK